MQVFILVLSVGIISSSLYVTAKETPKIDNCKFYNPDLDIVTWGQQSENNICTDEDLIKDNSDEEKSRRAFGSSQFAFNVLASDKIGPIRDYPDYTHQLCKDELKKMQPVAESVSIIIVYHNEATSVLVRMLNSILKRTPTDNLKEIILLDDYSTEENVLVMKLKQYGDNFNWPMDKLTMQRTEQREGLIRAKVIASRLSTTTAKSQMAGSRHFFPNFGLNPNRWPHSFGSCPNTNTTRAVLPLVDIISPKDFNISNAMISRGGFTRELRFEWLYFPWSHFDDPANYAKPYESAAMSGGLLAMRRSWFLESGEYDWGMEIWGGENAELSLRLWLCGDGVFVAPCSRVAHVFRYSRPYGLGPNGTDTTARNTQRAAAVWLGDHRNAFLAHNAQLQRTPMGDVADRLALRDRLRCRDFDWYLDHVHPEFRSALYTKRKEEL